MLIVEPFMYRATYDNVWKEDISAGFREVQVSMDTNREYTWEMDATLTWERWESLDIFDDWLAPVLRVTWPDGTVDEGQLGLYMVLDSKKDHRETYSTVKLLARDPLWMLDRQGFIGPLRVPSGTPKLRVVKEILDGSVLTESPSGKRRYAIPSSEHIFGREAEWSRKTSKLDIMNEVLEGCGHYPLWTTKHGVITTKRAGVGRLKDRHPVRFYSAHVPPEFELPARYRPRGGVPSEVNDSIPMEPRGGQDLDNEILIINDTMRGQKINAKGKITHPANPRSVFHLHGRRHVRPIHNKILEEDATAQQVADAVADELSTRNSGVQLTCFPDVRTEFARESIGLAVWNVWGRKIALGQYAARRVTYRFSMSGLLSKMIIDAGRIDDAQNYLKEAS